MWMGTANAYSCKKSMLTSVEVNADLSGSQFVNKDYFQDLALGK